MKSAPKTLTDLAEVGRQALLFGDIRRDGELN